MSASLAPLSTDPAAARRFRERAIGARVAGGHESSVWAEEFSRRLDREIIPARLYCIDGRAEGLSCWSPAGPLGVIVHLLYASAEASRPEAYLDILRAVESDAGPIAFLAGPLAGLSEAVERVLLRSVGFRPYARSEMVLGPRATSVEPLLPGERVRPVEPTDLPALIELHRAAYHGHLDRYLFLDDLDEGTDAGIAVNEILDGRWGAFHRTGSWVLESSGQTVGAVLSVRTPDGVLIADVTVLPELQGRGIGRRVLGRALAALRAESEARIYLNVTEGNIPATRLYARLGFVRSLGPSRDWYNVARVPVLEADQPAVSSPVARGCAPSGE